MFNHCPNANSKTTVLRTQPPKTIRLNFELARSTPIDHMLCLMGFCLNTTTWSVLNRRLFFAVQSQRCFRIRLPAVRKFLSEFVSWSKMTFNCLFTKSRFINYCAHWAPGRVVLWIVPFDSWPSVWLQIRIWTPKNIDFKTSLTFYLNSQQNKVNHVDKALQW